MAKVQLEHSTVFVQGHDKSVCKKQTYCTLHKRSDHPMRRYKQHWRDDRGLMERICLHGVGHPDPDHILSMRERGCSESSIRNASVHGCCGCCSL